MEKWNTLYGLDERFERGLFHLKIEQVQQNIMKKYRKTKNKLDIRKSNRTENFTKQKEEVDPEEWYIDKMQSEIVVTVQQTISLNKHFKQSKIKK